MPHRLLELPPVFLHTVEGVILGLALGWNAMSYYAQILSERDWQRMTGPHGVAFIAVVAAVVLWLNKISSDKARSKELAEQDAKEDLRRVAEELNKEKRHAETLAASREYADSMKALAVESMKVAMKVDFTLVNLTHQLASRPCQAASFKSCDNFAHALPPLPPPPTDDTETV
jgi:hypothetical protein